MFNAKVEHSFMHRTAEMIVNIDSCDMKIVGTSVGPGIK